MSWWQGIIVVVVLLVLLPIGDSLNRWARSGGTYTPRLPDVRAWREQMRVRRLLRRTPKRHPETDRNREQ